MKDLQTKLDRKIAEQAQIHEEKELDGVIHQIISASLEHKTERNEKTKNRIKENERQIREQL